MNTAPTSPGTSSELLVVPCVRVDPLLYTWLHVAADRFAREARDPGVVAGRNLERVRAHWAAGGADMMLWLLVEQGGVHGYGISEVAMGRRGRYCFVAEGWFEPAYRARGALREAFLAISGWAKARNCSEVVFSTRRNPAAYVRLLRRDGWRQAETVLEKTL